MNVCRRSRGIPPLILNHGSRRKQVVSFTPLPLSPGERERRTHQENKRLGGSKIRFKPIGGGKKKLASYEQDEQCT